MSVKVSSWVWHGEETSGLSGNEMILLLALADVADDSGRCRYVEDGGLSYEGLARKVRVDRRTIERLIPRLRDRGLLEHSKGSKGRANEFLIRVPWVSVSTDNLSVNPAADVSSFTDKMSANPAVAEADSPTAVQHSPTAVTLFPDNGDVRSSLKRIDVLNVKRGRPSSPDTRIPDPFLVTAEMRNWAALEVPSVDVDLATRMFVDHWRAVAGSRGLKRDWISTWRNWLRREATYSSGSSRRAPSKVDQGRASHEELLRRQQAGQKGLAS